MVVSEKELSDLNRGAVPVLTWDLVYFRLPLYISFTLDNGGNHLGDWMEQRNGLTSKHVADTSSFGLSNPLNSKHSSLTVWLAFDPSQLESVEKPSHKSRLAQLAPYLA